MKRCQRPVWARSSTVTAAALTERRRRCGKCNPGRRRRRRCRDGRRLPHRRTPEHVHRLLPVVRRRAAFRASSAARTACTTACTAHWRPVFSPSATSAFACTSASGPWCGDWPGRMVRLCAGGVCLRYWCVTTKCSSVLDDTAPSERVAAVALVLVLLLVLSGRRHRSAVVRSAVALAGALICAPIYHATVRYLDQLSPGAATQPLPRARYSCKGAILTQGSVPGGMRSSSSSRAFCRARASTLSRRRCALAAAPRPGV